MRRVALRSLFAAMALTGGALGESPANAQSSYVIGYITDLSGPLADSYTPTWEGFELYVKSLNDRGGIGGKKVNVTLDDDGLKADRAVAAAKKQVERDNVIGIFGLESLKHSGARLRGNAQGGCSRRYHIQRHPRRAAAGEALLVLDRGGVRSRGRSDR